MAQELRSITLRPDDLQHPTGFSNSTTGASSPVRPNSSYTINSTFADSAVDMDGTTSTESPDEASKLHQPQAYPQSQSPQTPISVDQSLSDKMRRLAAVAWTNEQDDNMTEAKRHELHVMLQAIESSLDAPLPDNEEIATGKETIPLSSPNRPAQIDRVATLVDSEQEEDDEWIDESELITVRQNLSLTLKAMRQRQEEQRHLHHLTVQKLEAVAQRCLAQEQQAQDLLHEVRQLRLENQSLTCDNDRLREYASILETNASRNEVAVEAMSSAVTGLEGWIQSAQPSSPQTPVPPPKAKRQKVVIRGKGRFRGRYYVDEDGDNAVAYSLADAAADSQELHDGVKAWLRGFRDVEEELRQQDSPTRTRPQGRFKDMRHREETDWGDFESPSSPD